MASVWITPTLPGPSTASLVEAAVRFSDTDTRDVAVKVKRHGVRRAFFTSCANDRCALQATPSDYAEGGAMGRGHLYARRGDLAPCRSANRIVAVDRTSHWVTGRAYAGVPYPATVAPGTRYLITLKVPQVRPGDLLPADRTYHRAKRAGATRIERPEDDLVFVLAHELHHVHQFRHDLPRSEVAAEQAGRAVLQDWVAAGRPGAPAGGADVMRR
ncbi:MAG TPA: hypothetical protein VMM13_06175 [Euzebya sp.]|nr:hypothetical protein [Euzebya sp.]